MSRTQGFRWVVVAVVSAVGAMAPAARAVKPGEWVHQTEADFQSAELDHTVITNLGRVELSRASDQLANLPEDDAIVYDIAVAGGRTYLAVGPKGRLAELTAEHKIAELAAFENEQVFALAADGEAVWVGVSGADGRIEKRVGETVQETIKLPGVRYVWDVLVVGGKLWVATGTEGQVLVVDPQAPDGEPIVALDTDQKNVLCLAADDKQQVYAGTDGEGLIYRIAANPRAGQEEEKPFSVFVLYDAAEPEIGALVVTADGTVYAGTADADQARPGRLAEAVQEEKGETEKPQPEAGRIKDGDEGGDGGNGDEVPPAPEPQPEPEPKPETAPAPDTPPAEDGAPDKPPADDNRVEGVGESGPPGPSAAPGTEVVIGRPTAFALQEADAAPAPSDTPGPAADARPDAPTKQQYTALRKVVSERLARLRKGQQAVEQGKTTTSEDLKREIET